MTISACSTKREYKPDINYNGSSVIKLTINNFVDTTIFSYKTTPILPYGCVIKNEEINHNGDYYFTYRSTIPDNIQFSIIKNFQTYLIPNDTLKILVNLDPSIETESAVIIDGVYGDIKNYYDEKSRVLGYEDMKIPLANYSNPSLTLEKAFALSDSIFQSEINFLIDYKKNHDLPDWFCNIIKMDIEYFKIQLRPYLIDFRKYHLHEDIKDPEAYYIFDQMPVYNPDAKLSKLYYDYLQIYFGLKHEDLYSKSGLERMVPLFERSIPEAQKELKGDVLEYYLASNLSDIILSCRQKEQLEKVDSVFIPTKSLFSNKAIVEMLESERKKIEEFIITATTNNPFSFTSIITSTKK